MSAPTQGRQSPDPATQHPSQGTAQQAHPNDQGAGPTDAKHAQDASNKTLDALPSNPAGPLDKAAEAKTKKGPGNDSGAVA